MGESAMVSIVIPTCNAEKGIATTLEDYISYFSAEHHQDFEIIVVTNGCVDRTPKIVNEYSSKFPQVRSKEIEERIGKGGALMEGFKMACGDVIAFVDADESTSPEELHKLIKELGENVGAIASRWLPGSNILVKQALTRRIASRGFNLLVRLLFGLSFTDTQCGAKAFKRHAVEELLPRLRMTNFAFDVELLHGLNKSGYKVKEIPITWEEKQGSTLNLKKAIPAMFLAVVMLRILNSPFKRIAENRLYGSILRKVR